LLACVQRAAKQAAAILKRRAPPYITRT